MYIYVAFLNTNDYTYLAIDDYIVHFILYHHNVGAHILSYNLNREKYMAWFSLIKSLDIGFHSRCTFHCNYICLMYVANVKILICLH